MASGVVTSCFKILSWHSAIRAKENHKQTAGIVRL
jgi:hypothetical protein